MHRIALPTPPNKPRVGLICEQKLITLLRAFYE